MDKSKIKKPRINWEEILKIAYHEAKNYYDREGFAPTLRAIFYILIGKNIIPNTKTVYKTFSDVLAKARYRNEFPHYLITDDTREASFLEKLEKYAQELSEEEIKQKLKELVESYAAYSINIWEDQPKRIIICVEKNTIYKVVKSWLEEFTYEGLPLGVYNLRSMRGFDSATDIINVAKLVNKLRKDGYIPVIQIISDFDPSGEEIFADFSRRIKDLSGVQDLLIEKVMITKEQIDKYGLPSAPESKEEIEKLRRDSRYKKFVEKYGLIRVEVDALLGINPSEMKKILYESILKHFDKSIFETKTKMRIQEARSKSEEAKKNMLEKVKKIIGE
jgi:hypothetical protein